MIGNPHPDFILGLNLNLDYKGIYLALSGYGMFGHQNVKSYHSPGSVMENMTVEEYESRWHGEGTSDRNPRLLAASHRNVTYFSDYSFIMQISSALTTLPLGMISAA